MDFLGDYNRLLQGGPHQLRAKPFKPQKLNGGKTKGGQTNPSKVAYGKGGAGEKGGFPILKPQKPFFLF